MKKVKKDILLKLMSNIQKNYVNIIVTYHFYLKEENFKSLLLIYIMKFKTSIKLQINFEKSLLLIYIKKFKTSIKLRINFEKVHRLIRFNQDEWMKPYIEMNSKIRQKAKNNFENDFFNSINLAVFEKTMENVRKHRDIKLVTIERRRNYLVSEPNYHTTKFFT